MIENGEKLVGVNTPHACNSTVIFTGITLAQTPGFRGHSEADVSEEKFRQSSLLPTDVQITGC